MNWSKTTLALALAACLGLTPVQAKSRTGDETFAIGDRKFLLNGRPFLIKAAEIHYARIPSDYWEHRIEMCKALGMNTICIYTFWNFHEQQPGQFNFKGDHDVARFCRLVQKHGMYVILRPGPYACAEWEMGGLPWWLLKKQDVRLRSTDPYFLERVKIYMDRMGEELADLQITRGGNIIMVQVENEFGAYGEDKPYVSAVRDIVRGAGFTDVPLFQCDWSSTFKRNGLDDLVWTINFGTGANIDAQFAALKEARPHTPLMCSEFWSGWFDHWGRKHETRDATAMVQGIDDMLQRGISFSLYMAHGGTTFGHWGGANCPPYSAMCSSYDYDAPISEAGWATPKYHKLRALLEQYADSGQVIPDIPAPMPVISIPAFTVDEAAPLFDNLPEPKHSDDVRPMEQYDQGWGSILYRTRLPEVKEGTVLEITEPHDWTQVYADGRLLGRLDRRHGETSIVLPALPAGTRLDILVEAMGRVNFDVAIHDRKGITEKVELVDGDARQAQIHARVIDGQEQIRTLRDEAADERPVQFPKERQTFEHFPETDDARLRSVRQQFGALFAHPVAAQPEKGECAVRELPAQFAHQRGTVHVAGDFPCANHDAQRRLRRHGCGVFFAHRVHAVVEASGTRNVLMKWAASAGQELISGQPCPKWVPWPPFG